jgi:hypothetical protein
MNSLQFWWFMNVTVRRERRRLRRFWAVFLVFAVGCGAAGGEDARGVPSEPTEPSTVNEPEPLPEPEPEPEPEPLPEPEPEPEIPLCEGETGWVPGDCQTLVYNPVSGYCNQFAPCAQPEPESLPKPEPEPLPEPEPEPEVPVIIPGSADCSCFETITRQVSCLAPSVNCSDSTINGCRFEEEQERIFWASEASRVQNMFFDVPELYVYAAPKDSCQFDESEEFPVSTRIEPYFTGGEQFNGCLCIVQDIVCTTTVNASAQCV